MLTEDRSFSLFGFGPDYFGFSLRFRLFMPGQSGWGVLGAVDSHVRGGVVGRRQACAWWGTCSITNSRTYQWRATSRFATATSNSSGAPRCGAPLLSREVGVNKAQE